MTTQNFLADAFFAVKDLKPHMSEYCRTYDNETSLLMKMALIARCVHYTLVHNADASETYNEDDFAVDQCESMNVDEILAKIPLFINRRHESLFDEEEALDELVNDPDFDDLFISDGIESVVVIRITLDIIAADLGEKYADAMKPKYEQYEAVRDKLDPGFLVDKFIVAIDAYIAEIAKD